MQKYYSCNDIYLKIEHITNNLIDVIAHHNLLPHHRYPYRPCLANPPIPSLEISPQ